MPELFFKYSALIVREAFLSLSAVAVAFFAVALSYQVGAKSGPANVIGWPLLVRADPAAASLRQPKPSWRTTAAAPLSDAPAARRAAGDGLIHPTRGPADDRPVRLLDGDDAGEREDVRVGRAGVGLLDRFQPLDGLGEARVAAVGELLLEAYRAAARAAVLRLLRVVARRVPGQSQKGRALVRVALDDLRDVGRHRLVVDVGGARCGDCGGRDGRDDGGDGASEDGAAFERGVGLRHVAARIKASNSKIITLRRGFAPVGVEVLAAVLQRRGALAEDGAAALMGEVAEVCRRAALWDERGEVVSDFDDVSVDVVERRPALCCRVVDYDDETYAVWTLDGRSGAEWRVRRSFARFREVRSVVKRLAPRDVYEELDRTFPDEAAFYDTVSSIQDRCRALETYVRRCLSLLLTGPLHNKAGRLHACLEDFLDVPARLASLELLERNPDAHLRRAAQVAAHQILATPSLDGVVSTIVEACRGKEGHDLLSAMATAVDAVL